MNFFQTVKKFSNLANTLERFKGKDSSGKRKSTYIRFVYSLSDNDLEEECKKVIWLSARNHNIKSDYHWKLDVCYAASQFRDEESSIYNNAHEKLMKIALCRKNNYFIEC
jgi:hypothetical protein